MCQSYKKFVSQDYKIEEITTNETFIEYILKLVRESVHEPVDILIILYVTFTVYYNS